MAAMGLVAADVTAFQRLSQGNRTVAMAAVRRDGMALKFASQAMQDDSDGRGYRAVVMAAARQNWSAGGPSRPTVRPAHRQAAREVTLLRFGGAAGRQCGRHGRRGSTPRKGFVTTEPPSSGTARRSNSRPRGLELETKLSSWPPWKKTAVRVAEGSRDGRAWGAQASSMNAIRLWRSAQRSRLGRRRS